MNWARERFTDDETTSRNSRNNHHVEFEYDSADLPFSPPTRSSGHLESGLPFWKTNITDPDKYLYPPVQTSSASDQTFSPLFKFVTSNSRSHENVSVDVNSGQSRPLITQSLPATPLSTPGPTPVPTPQSSPSLSRKNTEMESARVNQDQLSSNVKWFYLGFRSAQSSPSSGPVEISSNQPAIENSSKVTDSVHASNMSSYDNVQKAQDFRPLSYLQKRALVISNRDMNFLAPTSM